MNEWFERSTGVEELDRCSITLGHLYFGGMKEGRDEEIKPTKGYNQCLH